jgi:hypothetical protein
MLRHPFRAAIIAGALLALGAVSAMAGNNTFFTSIGDLVFPFTPPSNAGATPGTIDNMAIGATTPAAGTFSSITNKGLAFGTQPAPFAATVSATLTTANLQTLIITVLQGAGANSAQQLPLATAMDTAFSAAIVGSSFDFYIVNISSTAAETASVTTNTGWTLVGSMSIGAIGAATSETTGHFRARKTGTGTWTLYRLA